MKLGLLSAILESCSFEEMISLASDLKFDCVEVACWPKGKAKRRYAGVSHIDVLRVIEDIEYSNYIKSYVQNKKIKISSLAYYPNIMDKDKKSCDEAQKHLLNVIHASSILDVRMVTTFIGRDQTLTVEENLISLKNIWQPIIDYAEEKNVKIAIENCPMLFGEEQWPGGQNLMTTPEIWRKVFEILPSDNLGINYDPSHFVWQFMDYIKPLYEFKDKLFHVHFKDIKLFRDRLDQVGIMAYPLEYMSPKIPGLGDINWSAYVSALNDIGYDGCACIEVEDRSFENTKKQILDSIKLSKKYLEQYII